MATKCFDEVVKELTKLGKDIPDDELNQILRDMDTLKESAIDDGDFRHKATQYIIDNKALRTNARHERLISLRLISERESFYDTLDLDAKDQRDAIIAKIGGLTRVLKGGNESASLFGKALKAKIGGDLINQLEEKNLLKIFKSGELEKQIMVEKWELKPGGRPGISGSPEAREIAELLRNVDKVLMDEHAKVGVFIHELEGRIMSQTHDSNKLRHAGKDSELAFQTWKGDIDSKLDGERTFGIDHLDPKFREKFLRNAYNDIVFGKNQIADGTQLSDEMIFVSKGSQNLSKKATFHRKLHFKSAEDFYDYNQAYGRKDLLDSVVGSISQQSKNIGLMKYFGSNPGRAVDQDIARAISKLEKAGKFEDAQIFRKKYVPKIQNVLKEAQGLTNIPAEGLVAKTGRYIRASQTMSKLGSSVFAAVSDLATSASILRASTGEGFLGSHWKNFSEFMSLIPPGNRKEWAKKLMVFTDEYMGEAWSRFDPVDNLSAPGALAKAERTFFKLNGLSTQTAIGRTAVAKVFAGELGDFSTSRFSDLPKRVSANLSRYGIGDTEWKTLKKSVETIGGNRFITPEGINKLDLPLKQKQDVQMKLISYLTDHAEIGVPEPGIRDRAKLVMGTDPNEPIGIFLRMLAQLRTFPITMHSVMSRIVLSDPDVAAKTFLKGAATTQGIKLVAGTVASGTILGYVGMSARELSRGFTPPDPTDPVVIMDSFLRSGAGGLYADFVLGEYHKRGRSLIKDVAGPTLGQADDVARIMAGAARGEDVSADFFRLTRSNLPGQNLFWLRGTLDYYILDDMQEGLSPGFKRRRQTRLRDKGQKPIDFGEIFQ